MKTKHKTWRTRFIALFCAVTLSFGGSIAYADDVDTLKQQTTNLENQLDKLNSELNSLSAEITTLSSQITESKAAIAKAELDLAAAKLNEEMQYTSMKKRIKFMYETGNPSFMSMICTSENMADFLNRTEFVRTITEYDRNMLAELKDIRTDIEEKEAALQEEQNTLLEMQKSLSAKSDQLNSLIASTSSELVASAQALANAQNAQNAANSAGSSSSGGNTTSTPSTGTSTDDLVLFAALLQCEAGSTNYNALLAVATVVMNRLNSSNYPNTLYGVIYQRGQFSPTWNGSLKRVLARGPAALCYQVAQDALNGSRLAAVQHCYFFNASYTGKPGIIVGGNVFW